MKFPSFSSLLLEPTLSKMYNIDILTKVFDFVDEMDEAIFVSLYKDQIIFRFIMVECWNR